MATARSKYLLRAAMAGTIGLISLLFFPFAGFTEATAYSPGPIYREYGLAGLGTHGLDFNLFGYPRGVGIIQVLILAAAVAMVYPISRCWKWYQAPGSETASALRFASRVTMGIGAVSVILVAVALLAVFPGVEDETIWQTETSGAVIDWWLGYGAFVTALSVGAMAVALALRVHHVPDGPPAPPAQPPAPPPVEPPPPPGE